MLSLHVVFKLTGTYFYVTDTQHHIEPGLILGRPTMLESLFIIIHRLVKVVLHAILADFTSLFGVLDGFLGLSPVHLALAYA